MYRQSKDGCVSTAMYQNRLPKQCTAHLLSPLSGHSFQARLTERPCLQKRCLNYAVQKTHDSSHIVYMSLAGLQCSGECLETICKAPLLLLDIGSEIGRYRRVTPVAALTAFHSFRRCRHFAGLGNCMPQSTRQVLIHPASARCTLAQPAGPGLLGHSSSGPSSAPTSRY